VSLDSISLIWHLGQFPKVIGASAMKKESLLRGAAVLSRPATSTAVVILYVMAALPLTARNAFAQAGSTGGTIGKHGKSVSGSETEDQRRTPQRKNAAAAGCKLGSAWSNVAPAGSSVWTISSDGTALENGMGNARGRAVLSGRRLVITWRTTLNQGTYAITLNQACTAGSGTVAVVGGLLNGQVFSTTFTAMAAPAN
jgi:hypothetical protein